MVPETRTVNVQGQEVEVKRIKVKQLSSVMAAITPFLYLLGDLKDSKTNAVDIAPLLTHHTESALVLISLLCDKDRAWLDELEIDELIVIGSAVLEVNLDFFIQKVLPSALREMERLKANFEERTKLAGQSTSKP